MINIKRQKTISIPQSSSDTFLNIYDKKDLILNPSDINKILFATKSFSLVESLQYFIKQFKRFNINSLMIQKFLLKMRSEEREIGIKLITSMPSELFKSVPSGEYLKIGFELDDSQFIDAILEKSILSKSDNDIFYNIYINHFYSKGLIDKIEPYLSKSTLINISSENEEITIDLHGCSHGSGILQIKNYIQTNPKLNKFILITGKGNMEKGNFLSFRKKIESYIHLELQDWRRYPIYYNPGRMMLVKIDHLLSQQLEIKGFENFEYDHVLCSICYKRPSPAVRLLISVCPCKNKMSYCLTCIRDSLNLNGCKNGYGENGLKGCSWCYSDFTIPATTFQNDKDIKKSGVNNIKIYDIWDDLNKYLDDKYGDVRCPRKCKWVGKRSDIRKHLSRCCNAYRFTCKACHQMFTKKQLDAHKIDIIECKICNKEFHEDQKFIDQHMKTHPKCEICGTWYKNNHFFKDHLNLHHPDLKDKSIVSPSGALLLQSIDKLKE